MPGADGGLITVDLDATLVTSYSEKENTRPTWKKTFGFHSLAAFADGGEPLAILLRPGNAGSNTAADHIETAKLALAHLPRDLRRRVLIRADSGGGTHDFLNWLTAPGRWLTYSVGTTITEDMHQAILKVPARAWTPAYDAERQPRDGAWVAEITGILDLEGWPKGMRLIVRKERPHPGAQLRFTAAAAVLRGRPPGPRRPAAAAAPRRPMALEPGHHHRYNPAAATSTRLASPTRRRY